MGAFTALFDACVLYPQTLRDVLLSLARTDLFLARWSAHINEEMGLGSSLCKRPDLADQIAYTLDLVNKSVEDCLVVDYDAPDRRNQELPDPDDRQCPRRRDRWPS